MYLQNRDLQDVHYMGSFSRILESLPPLPRQHWAAIGCTKNYQPIGVTVHSHCVESFEGLLQRCRRGRGCSGFEKNTIFPEHSVSIVRTIPTFDSKMLWFLLLS